MEVWDVLLESVTGVVERVQVQTPFHILPPKKFLSGGGTAISGGIIIITISVASRSFFFGYCFHHHPTFPFAFHLWA